MVKWEEKAEQDLADIVVYIASDNLDAAMALLDEIDSKVEMLLSHPRLYKQGRVDGTRELLVRPNYIVIYAVEENGSISILRVLHAAQQWP